jgi:glycerate kinase
MPLRVLVVPDKFKGTLAASEAARAIATGWRRARPRDVLTCLPMSDGGDGFGVVMGGLLGARRIPLRTVDAAHRPLRAAWWWDVRTRTAVIDSAGIIGLALLPAGRFHPFDLDTYGLGAALRAAERKGARRCVIGIGGSATNDGGFGLARALGWRFFDAAGTPLTRWTELHRLHRIEPPGRRAARPEWIVAVDVQNRLLGARGASRVYGPQKGLRPEEFREAERNLRQLARVMRSHLGRDCAAEPGSGAAGGLGFGLRAFGGARFEPGFTLFARLAKLEGRLRRSDLLITGEGAMDRQTLMGKGVGELVALGRRRGVPCIGLAGHIKDRARIERRFARVAGLTDLTSARAAMAKPAVWLEKLAFRVAQDWTVGATGAHGRQTRN